MNEIEEIKLDIDYHEKQLETLNELIPRLQNDKHTSEQMLIVLENRLKLAEYTYWIRLREKSKDECDEKLCYCGHTYKCSCANPDKQMFRESVQRGSIILTDKNNGWKNAI